MNFILELIKICNIKGYNQNLINSLVKFFSPIEKATTDEQKQTMLSVIKDS